MKKKIYNIYLNKKGSNWQINDKESWPQNICNCRIQWTLGDDLICILRGFEC